LEHSPSDRFAAHKNRNVSMQQNPSVPVADTPDLRPVFAPAAALPGLPADLRSFADVDALIARDPDWTQTDREPARSVCRGVAARPPG
jgi:hypothetical protein